MRFGNYYFVFLAAVSCIWPLSVFTVSIEPVAQSLSLEQGEGSSITVELTNTSDTARTYSPYVFGVIFDANGTPLYTKDSGVIAWITAPSEIVIEPQRTETLTYDVHAPYAALPGAYYVALFAGEESPGQIATEAHVGSILTLYIAGDIEESLYVRNIDVTAGEMFSTAREAAIQVQNDGNIHIASNLRYRVQGGNTLIKEQPLEIGTVYKGMERSETVSFDLPQWYIGTIVFSVVGTYGISQHVLQGTVSFFYVSPYVFAVGIALIFGIVIGILYRYNRKKRVDV